MTGVTISTIADFPIAAAAVMGFTPTESLVVMGNRGGPTARVDLGEGAVESLAPAAHHWREVVLIVFSDTPQARAYRAEFKEAYPWVRILDALDVQGDTVTSLATGETTPVAPIAPGVLGDRIIAGSRDSLVAEAQRVTDPAEALRLAAAYYGAGNGARAWAYVDRTRELGGDPSVIEAYLVGAVDPRGDA